MAVLSYVCTHVVLWQVVFDHDLEFRDPLDLFELLLLGRDGLDPFLEDGSHQLKVAVAQVCKQLVGRVEDVDCGRRRSVRRRRRLGRCVFWQPDLGLAYPEKLVNQALVRQLGHQRRHQVHLMRMQYVKQVVSCMKVA